MNSKSVDNPHRLALVLDIDCTLLQCISFSHFQEKQLTHIEKETLDVITLTETGQELFYYIKTRPHLDKFLMQANDIFELSIYTHGTRHYADKILAIIDPKNKYFQNRIVSRQETGNAVETKSLFLLYNDHRNVLILDDKIEVWESSQRGNLLLNK